MKRHIIVKIALIVVYLVLFVTMFCTGRSHTALIDNKGAEDGSYEAVASMKVSVDGSKPLEFFKNDRDLFPVKGQTATIKIEFKDGTPAKTFKVKIPFKSDAVLISIPKLIAGLDAVEHFEL